MSATVEANTSSSPWGKRRREEDATTPPKEPKRTRYYFRLESESSKCSADEDTESVYSWQDKETDIVQDTSDTETERDSDRGDEFEVEIEYEVASLSEGEDGNDLFNSSNSSGSEDASMMLAAAAAAICDSSLEAWVTDVEDSDNSSSGDTSLGRKQFPTCAQCRNANDHPLYRYCDKCFQQICRQCKMRKTYKCFPLCSSCYKDRKRYFPPRPRRHRKPRKKQEPKPEPPVKLDTLQSCLSGLSQDSGIGSSQELASLELDRIVVPEHLTAGTSRVSPVPEEKSPQEVVVRSQGSAESRKRQLSESSLSDYDVDAKKAKVTNVVPETRPVAKTDDSDLCIFCNDAPKDSIFLHTKIAHRCCCYRCAKKTLSTIKRCPICNRSVNKVVRIYTS